MIYIQAGGDLPPTDRAPSGPGCSRIHGSAWIVEERAARGPGLVSRAV